MTLTAPCVIEPIGMLFTISFNRRSTSDFTDCWALYYPDAPTGGFAERGRGFAVNNHVQPVQVGFTLDPQGPLVAETVSLGVTTRTTRFLNTTDWYLCAQPTRWELFKRAVGVGQAPGNPLPADLQPQPGDIALRTLQESLAQVGPDLATALLDPGSAHTIAMLPTGTDVSNSPDNLAMLRRADLLCKLKTPALPQFARPLSLRTQVYYDSPGFTPTQDDGNSIPTVAGRPTHFAESGIVDVIVPTLDYLNHSDATVHPRVGDDLMFVGQYRVLPSLGGVSV